MNEQDSSVRVLLVDDQPMFRAGVGMLVNSQPDMHCVGEAENGAEALEACAGTRVDVILMDLRMPVMDGVTATERILAAHRSPDDPAPRIIALTTFNRDQAVIEAVSAGASGYLLKSAEPEFILSAIRTVHAGYSVIAPGSVHSLFRHASSAQASAPDFEVLDALSLREREVFMMAAKGLGNQEIAESLFITEATVKTHVRSVLSKLKLRTRIQLVAFAYEHHLMGS